MDWGWTELERRSGTSSDVKPTLETFKREFSVYFRRQVQDGSWPPYISIEGTPGYFHAATTVPARMRRILPDAMLVLALRDPVSRTISHYVGKQHSDFKRFSSCGNWFMFYRKQIDKKCGTKIITGENIKFQSRCLLELSENPLARSIYAPQLEAWLEHYPASQIHLLRSESFFADPRGHMDRLVAWLGLRPYTESEAINFDVPLGSRHMEKFHKKHLSDLEHVSGLDCNEAEMVAFFAPFEDHLLRLLQLHFPTEAAAWIPWSGRGRGIGTR